MSNDNPGPVLERIVSDRKGFARVVVDDEKFGYSTRTFVEIEGAQVNSTEIQPFSIPGFMLEATHPRDTDDDHDRVRMARIKVAGTSVIYGSLVYITGIVTEAHLYTPEKPYQPEDTDEVCSAEGCEPHGWGAYLPPKVKSLIGLPVRIEYYPGRVNTKEDES